jgi:hypothetical protein
MAVRSGITAHETYQQFQALVRQLKQELIGADGTGGWAARLATQDIPWMEFTRAQQMLTLALGQMAATAATPGIVAYVQAQEQDATYNISTEYVTLRDSVTAIRDWIFNNMPKVVQGGTSYLAVVILAQDGSMTDRIFTPAMTAGLRTLITGSFKNSVM